MLNLNPPPPLFIEWRHNFLLMVLLLQLRLFFFTNSKILNWRCEGSISIIFSSSFMGSATTRYSKCSWCHSNIHLPSRWHSITSNCLVYKWCPSWRYVTVLHVLYCWPSPSNRKKSCCHFVTEHCNWFQILFITSKYIMWIDNYCDSSVFSVTVYFLGNSIKRNLGKESTLLCVR